MKQPLSFIHPEAKIADNVTIDPFVTISKDVEIDDGTWIGSNVVIMDGARIGKNCRIFPGAVISAIPQDLKFKGEITTVHIGDNTTIRECATVNRGTAAKGKTIIGNNCLLMAYSHIAHDCKIGDHVIIGNSSALAGEVNIDDWAILSGLVGVHQFVNIGKHAMLGGGAMTRKDVPPYVTAARDPVAYFGINSIGLRRRGFSNEKIEEIQTIYRVIYQEKYNTTQALEYIENNFPPTDERDEILNFIKSSKRGIIRGGLDGD